MENDQLVKYFPQSMHSFQIQNMMTHKSFLFTCLAEALIQVREQSIELENKKLYYISHLLHNLPLKLAKVTSDEEYEKLWLQLYMDFRELGIEAWIDEIKTRWEDER